MGSSDGLPTPAILLLLRQQLRHYRDVPEGSNINNSHNITANAALIFFTMRTFTAPVAELTVLRSCDAGAICFCALQVCCVASCLGLLTETTGAPSVPSCAQSPLPRRRALHVSLTERGHSCFGTTGRETSTRPTKAASSTHLMCSVP